MKIKKLSNGFLLETKEDKIVFEFYYDPECSIEVSENSPNKDELQALGRLLDYIAQELGYDYNKFNEDNLKISFNNKGHKLD